MPVKAELDAIEGRSDLSPAQKRDQRLALKAQRIGAVLSGLIGKSFKLDNITWTVEDASIEGPLVRTVLSAKQGSQVLLTADDPRNPFYWHNPPTQVPDGTFTDVPHPNLPGVTYRRPGLKEDLLAAAKEMIRGIDL